MGCQHQHGSIVIVWTWNASEAILGVARVLIGINRLKLALRIDANVAKAFP
jgi:hypothetical protein